MKIINKLHCTKHNEVHKQKLILPPALWKSTARHEVEPIGRNLTVPSINRKLLSFLFGLMMGRFFNPYPIKLIKYAIWGITVFVPLA